MFFPVILIFTHFPNPEILKSGHMASFRARQLKGFVSCPPTKDLNLDLNLFENSKFNFRLEIIFIVLEKISKKTLVGIFL